MRVNHQVLAVLGPVQVSQGAGKADVCRAVLGKLLLSAHLLDINLREAAVRSKGNILAARRDLNVFDPGIFLVSEGSLSCAENL